jgi:hypothetical protein
VAAGAPPPHDTRINTATVIARIAFTDDIGSSLSWFYHAFSWFWVIEKGIERNPSYTQNQGVSWNWSVMLDA